MEFQIEYSDGIFYGKSSGDAETSVFADLLDAMLDHEKWQPGSRWLHDHSDLNSGPLTMDDVQEIALLCAERRQDLGAGKCAIVVRRDLEFGLARMWGGYIEGRWDMSADIFRSRTKALAWLTV